MGALILIDVLAALAVAGVWYLCFARYNRRKGFRALRQIEAACSSRARIVEARWLGASRLQAHLRFAAHWFENAHVTIRLLPRPLPIPWLLSRWHKQRETVTFEADLDYAPGLRLDVFRHHWVSDNTRALTRRSPDWMVARPGPIVLTTSTEWRQELPPIVSTLMTARGHSLLRVRFRPESPHLAATIDLDALSDREIASGFLGVLRDLAAGASTSRH